MCQMGIYNSITPIMKISSIFGLLSIRIIKDTGKPSTEFNKLQILLPATYMGITTLLIYEVISSATKLEESKYGIGILYIGVLFIFIGNILALYIIYFMNAMASATISKVINKISKVDELMRLMVNKIDHQSHFKYEMYIISGCLLSTLVQIVLHYHTLNAQQSLLNERMLFLIAFPIITRMVLGIQYSIFIKLLHERFIILNRELHSLQRVENCKRYNMVSTKTIQKNIWKGWVADESKCSDTQLRNVEQFMKVHDTLSEAGNMISTVFSVQILASFTTYLINEIFTIFYAYFEMMYYNYIPALHWFGWIIIINLEMLQITTICHQTINEASKTVCIIHKLLSVTQLNKGVKEKLFIFSQQLQQLPLKFSACGLFSIDGKLLFMVTCASSMYLLVMFQYQEGIEMQCFNKSTNSTA